MLNILGEHYYIDLDKIEEYLDISEIDSDSSSPDTIELKINVIKFEMVKMLLETVLSEHEHSDEALGIKPTTSIPFKLAFNSLLNKKLINHY